jgi:uncharacterized protein YkwD
MGRAVITENLGEGLYKIRPVYDDAALKNELAALQTASANYYALLIKAFNSLTLLERDTLDAANAKNAVIDQWRNQIISKTNPVPPVIPPATENDPETGEPWVDPDRAQEAPLLALVNALRASASVSELTRDDDLDTAALTHLRNQAGTNRIGHFGAYQSVPADRVLQQGYNAESVTEILSYGATSPDYVVSEWQKDLDTVADLINATATAAGVAYKYAPTHPHTHLWCLLIVKPGTGPIPTTETVYPPDPAKQQAENSEEGLERIKAPQTDLEIPPKLGEACQKYAIAVNKQLAAEKEVERLMAEKLARDARIAVLTELKKKEEEDIYCWCCMFVDNLDVGAEFSTAEVPGYLDNQARATSTTMGIRNDPRFEKPDHEVSYTERNVNIVPYTDSGKLRYSETMNSELVFFNSAIEPGHLKWRPLYRYGTITAKNGDLCDIALESAYARYLDARESVIAPLPLNAADSILTVPIVYPPENGLIFNVGDEVLVRFEGQNKDAPKVIGFRREPRTSVGRQSWRQL